MKTLFLNLYRGRHILRTMCIKDIKSRYAGSALGSLWIIATPLYQMLLYTFVFSVVLKVRFDDSSSTTSFAVYLLAGLIPWLFFLEGTTRGTSAFIENGHIIKKVKFPVELCVISVVLSSAFTFFLYLFFFLIMLLALGQLTAAALPLLILPLTIQVLLTVGLSLGLGSIAVFFRDVPQATGMVLNLVFFLTPIVYPPTVIPGEVKWLFTINPFCFLVEMYRSVLVRGTTPEFGIIVYPLLLAIGVFMGGYYVFSKTKEAFKDIL